MPNDEIPPLNNPILSFPSQQPPKILVDDYDDEERDHDAMIETVLDKNDANPNEKTKCATRIVKRIRRVLNSHRFHIVIIVLVAIDCLFVAGELAIDYIEMHLAKGNNDQQNDKQFLMTKQSDLDLAYRNATQNQNLNHDHHSPLAKLLKALEHICKYGSFTILLLFVIEICFKVIFTPRKCCKFFEIFDAIVVIVSFSVNFYLLVAGMAIHALSGLMTIFR
jgi:hypothetical protein